jgi:arylsulfatase A-like enzyme
VQKVTARLAHWLALSPEARGFFYVSALAHAALKVFLGLTLVTGDGYGFHSLVAPPQSLIFAGADVVICFGLAKLLDLAVPGRFTRLAQAVLLSLIGAFLAASFIIHSYFKTFLNRGLLEFNGASSHELFDYTWSALNGYALGFLTPMVALFVYYWARFASFARSGWAARTFMPPFLLAAGAAAMGFVGTLSAGQAGFLSYNPEFQLAQSYMKASTKGTPRASAAEARAFRDPSAPLFGRYESELAARLPRQAKRNVLFVLIESLPFEQTVLGSREGGLPVLRELAQQGVVFDNFRTVFPATSRSFLTYHCGIYPSAGAASATKYRPGYRCDSILDGLKAHGYRTGFFTSPMFTYDNLHKAHFMRSYDSYEDFLSLRARAKHDAFSAPAVEEEVVEQALLEFVDRAPAQPFFATYFMFWNHAPYRLPFDDISHLPPLARYKRTLRYLDQVLRDLLGQLKGRGRLDDTVVIVAADHGEGFALHHDNTNHIGHVFEDDVRIPFVIHVPDQTVGAQHTHRQGSNVDFAPTLFALLGLPLAPSWQGQDLLGEDFRARPTLLFGRSSYVTNALVDGQLKYIEYPETGKRLLFDLTRDPHEQHDLSGTHAREVAAYRKLIDAWLPVVEQRSWAEPRVSAWAPSKEDVTHAARVQPLGWPSAGPYRE